MMDDPRATEQAHSVRPGLCERCAHVQIVAGRHSTFYLCRLSFEDPRFPRYPPIPVLECSGFQPVAPPERP